jgi:hypothetical protein
VKLAASPSERFDQGLDVVDPVVEAAGGIDRLGLGAAEAAKIRGDNPQLAREAVGDVAPEPAGAEVAVNQQDRDTVLKGRPPNSWCEAGRCRCRCAS